MISLLLPKYILSHIKASIIEFSNLSIDTPNTEVYFTVTGTKPDIRVGGDTILYTKPFLLPKGKQTIKAIAVRKYFCFAIICVI